MTVGVETYFAEVDGGNVVLRVIVATQEYIDTGSLGPPERWLLSDIDDGGYRKNRADIGDTYDPVRDAFIPPCPHRAWVLNEETCNWEPPVPKPREDWMDPPDRYNCYEWDERNAEWVLNNYRIVDKPEPEIDPLTGEYMKPTDPEIYTGIGTPGEFHTYGPYTPPAE